MTTDRLSHAIEAGGLLLPDAGTIALWGAPGDSTLPPVDPARLEVIQRSAPETDMLQARGLSTRQVPEGPYAASIVTLPRARELAETRLAEAEAATAQGGVVVLDGAKTDGIEPMLKALRSRVTLNGQISKAHGKVLWFAAGDALRDWIRPEMSRNAEGDWTAPGVFSADASDPASRALAEALPKQLKGTVLDLGAGWGWLSREILRREGVTALHLVEADRSALECAKANIDDPRAVFHWADATTWRQPRALDVVVMNPPFHTGRKGDPRIGQAFIVAAARLLEPHGQLFMVANRHLPYEATIAEHFRDCTETGSDAKFKILHAARPKRTRR